VDNEEMEQTIKYHSNHTTPIMIKITGMSSSTSEGNRVEKNGNIILVPRIGVGETQLAINPAVQKTLAIALVSYPAPLRYPFYPNSAEKENERHRQKQ